MSTIPNPRLQVIEKMVRGRSEMGSSVPEVWKEAGMIGSGK